MLHKANPAQATALHAVVETIEEALFVLRELDPRTLRTERRMLYSAAYGLIRIGSVIDQNRAQLEQCAPDYPWQSWIDRRDNLALRPDLAKLPDKAGVDEIARALTKEAPQLVRDITGAEPNVSSKVGLEDLPIDDIADFCREWGIKEAYMVPMEAAGKRFWGPYEGVELVLLAKYRDDSPALNKTFTMGRLLSQAIGINTEVGHVPDPDDQGGHLNYGEMMARRELVYAE